MNIKRKALLLVAAVGLAGIFGSRLVAYQFGSGTMLTDPARNRVIIQVYNGDVLAHEDGDVLVWKDGTYDGVEVSTTTTENNALVAGVAFGDIAAGGWGWLQTHGYHDSVTVGTVAAGDSLVTGSTGEQAENYTVLQSTSSSPNDFGVFGVALTSDSAGVCKAFIIR